jgi:MFS family permease
MFLLLKARETSLSDVQTISLYIFYNLIYAMSSYQVGILSDRIGKKQVFLTGLVFFIITYGGMALTTRIEIFYLLFFFYGLFAACTEGIVKAWISNLCLSEDLATALGFQSTTQSIASMAASMMAGSIWYIFGGQYVFLMASLIATFVAAKLFFEKVIA